MKKKSPFLMQRNWVGARPANEGSRPSPRSRIGGSAPAPRRENRSRSSYRSASSYSSYSCGGSKPQPEGRNPSSIKPEEVICHGMQVTNVDNYIANLFR